MDSFEQSGFLKFLSHKIYGTLLNNEVSGGFSRPLHRLVRLFIDDITIFHTPDADLSRTR